MKLIYVVLLAAASLILHVPFLEARECDMNKECETKHSIPKKLHPLSKGITCDGECAAWQCVVDKVQYRVYGCEGDDQHICENKEGSEYYIYATSDKEHTTQLQMEQKLRGIIVNLNDLRDGECDPDPPIKSTKPCEKGRGCATKDYKVLPQDMTMMVECNECVIRSCLKDGVFYSEAGCENEKYVCNVGDIVTIPDPTKLRGGECDPKGPITTTTTTPTTTTSGTNDSKYGAFKLLGMILFGWIFFALLW